MKSLIKHIFAICISISSISVVSGKESLIESIENAYQSLDTIQYILDIKSAVYQDIKEEHKEMDETFVDIMLYSEFYDGVGTASRKVYLLDSLKEQSKKLIKEDYKNFVSYFHKSHKVEFVLNLHVEKDTIDGNVCYSLHPNKGIFPFTIEFLDKYPWRQGYQYSAGRSITGDVTFEPYVIFSREAVKKMSKAYRYIMKKKPTYFLYSEEFHNVGAILYIVNNKIYVYLVMEQEEYELDDYIEKFGLVR